MLTGYKTYILAVVAVLYALFGVFQGWMSGEQALQIIWTGLAAAGLRSGIASIKA